MLSHVDYLSIITDKRNVGAVTFTKTLSHGGFSIISGDKECTHEKEQNADIGK